MLTGPQKYVTFRKVTLFFCAKKVYLQFDMDNPIWSPPFKAVRG